MRGVIVGALLIYFIQSYVLIQLPGWIVSATSALNIDFLTKLDIGSLRPAFEFPDLRHHPRRHHAAATAGPPTDAQRKVELEGGTSDEARIRPARHGPEGDDAHP